MVCKLEQIHNGLGVKLFADPIRALTEIFHSKLTHSLP
jgi:hypothetical protein